jgi:hypothetical protein
MFTNDKTTDFRLGGRDPATRAMHSQMGPSPKEENTMSHTDKRRRVRDFLGPVIAGVMATWVVLQLSLVHLLLNAAKIEDKSKGDWGVITKVANQLQAPLFVIMLAAVPLGILGGGVLMVVGHRHAAKILGQVVAGVVIFGVGLTLAK